MSDLDQDLDQKLQEDRALLEEARRLGRGATLKAYAKLSGPGWLQSAITLGGGSLASSLYLGVLAGFSLLWLQPIAMILGIIMLSAIGYVALSTTERPFRAINQHVSPVLGWGWALATLAANMVWALPQYSLAYGVLEQNLLPEYLGEEGALSGTPGKIAVSVGILIASTTITWCYDSGGWGVRLYEGVLKAMVGVIVLCFVFVVIVLGFSEEGLQWGKILGGFVPNPAAIFSPSPEFEGLLSAVASGHREYWFDLIVAKQRDVLASAAATAVGINMTFLFPYTLIRRGWGKEFRGLAVFDLSTGMLIPFLLATSCVIIAANAQFHARPHKGLLLDAASVAPENAASAKQRSEVEALLRSRVAWEVRAERGEEFDTLAEDERSRLVNEGLASSPPAEEERRLASTLVTRDAFDLARSLRPLTGSLFSNIIFGIGVLGMTLSTITLLMLISGFVICEMFGLPPTGWPHRLGTLAAATGFLGPFVWGKAAFYLAVPTSIFGLILLPIAYLTFLLLMNQKSVLGEAMPRGARRVRWNLLMGTATLVAGAASLTMVWIKSESGFGSGFYGIGAVALFLGAALVVHLLRRKG